jgi:hypothetical protein
MNRIQSRACLDSWHASPGYILMVLYARIGALLTVQ